MDNTYNARMETVLYAAVSATVEERLASPDLQTGFSNASDSWEVIVRYTGDINELREEFPAITTYTLLGNYAIITVPANQIEELASSPYIVYMEKPRQLFYEVINGKRDSCITSLQFDLGLSGVGTIVAIIDSGIDYFHPDFRNADGTTRIMYLWDQSLGMVYSSNTINQALVAPSKSDALAICPSEDYSGHGTHVAGIAAGNGIASGGSYRGVAYEAELIIVKLATGTSSFSNTARLMEAIDFCISRAMPTGKPLSINLSYGNTYGSHSGTSLLETYIDYVSTLYKLSISVGSGNEADSGGHLSGKLSGNADIIYYQLAIDDFTRNLSIQIWKKYWDEITYSLILPNGEIIRLPNEPGTYRYTPNSNRLYITVGQPTPYSIYQEIYIDISGGSSDFNMYIESGIWGITARGESVIDGSFDLWLPSYVVRNRNTRFLTSTPDTTLTLPSSASRVITVGAYDSTADRPVSFSGRGYTWSTGLIKPELVAPGVNIISCAPGGGYISRSGTSMATPFVAGACALLMQWGIVDGNDPFMYGEKIKAALIRESKKLPFENSYPNPSVGWGALCVSLPT